MIIRKAKIEDAENIKQLLKITWLNTYKDFIPEKIIETITSNWHSVQNIQKQIQMDKVNFNVAEINQQITGILTIQNKDKGEYFLNRLYVNPDFQGQGIGKNLLNDFINSNQINKITLEVLKANNNAVNFYEKYGFVKTGESISDIEGFKLVDTIMEYNKSSNL